MKNKNAAVLVAVMGLLAALSCDSASVVSADASTHNGGRGSGGNGAGGQGGNQGGGGEGAAGGGTASDGGTAFTCGAESCPVGESYCKVVVALVLAADRRLSEPFDRKCVPFPVTCAERMDCSCFQPPASFCDGADQSCEVTDSGRVVLTCTSGG
jgi:hypothetical protein